MRAMRTVVGLLGLLVAVPVLLVGIGLWTVQSYRDPAGAFSASIDPIEASGYAVVVPDVDALLRRDAAFARGGRTVLRVTARTAAGPAFVGLAPAEAAGRYLDGVPYTQLTEVKLTRGPLPVRLTALPGTAQPPTPPAAQPFWIASPTASTDWVEWTPSAVRGQHLALVMMNVDGTAPLRVELRAAVTAGWLPSTTWGVLVLGALLLAVALGTLCWPARPREIVYVVDPGAPPTIVSPAVVSPTVASLAAPEPPVTGTVIIPRPALEPPPAPPVRLELDWPPKPAPLPALPEPAEAATSVSGPPG
jgi:hypothetical protein